MTARRAIAGARWLIFEAALALGVVASTLAAGSAGAEPTLPEASRTFEYEGEAPKHYFRPALEEAVALAAGLTHYYSQHDANAVDWDLDYDWPSFREKLVGSAYAFDTNRFDTNFVTHPAAGLVYYLLARGNRLSVLESFGYAFATSALWETLGEFREKVSINDLFVTPLAGMVLGESTTQLGAFFDRSCPNSVNRVLGSLLAPSKSLHDLADGENPRRDRGCDEHGLTTGGAHRFRLWAGSAIVESEHLGAPAAFGEVRLAFEARVAHLDSAGVPGHGWLSFSDGNVASIEGTFAWGQQTFNGLRVTARAVPVGLHHRDLRAQKGRRVVGDEFLAGFLVGVEYEQHRIERPYGKVDHAFLLNTPAAAVAWLLRQGPRTLELSLDAGTTLAGMDAFALGPYLATHGPNDLATVTRSKGYSHAFGFSASPRARLSLEGAELGIEARADRLFAIRARDRTHATVGRAVTETRRRARAWLEFGPPDGATRSLLSFEAQQRAGVIGSVRRTRAEVAAGIGLGLGF